MEMSRDEDASVAVQQSFRHLVELVAGSTDELVQSLTSTNVDLAENVRIIELSLRSIPDLLPAIAEADWRGLERVVDALNGSGHLMFGDFEMPNASVVAVEVCPGVLESERAVEAREAGLSNL